MTACTTWPATRSHATERSPRPASPACPAVTHAAVHVTHDPRRAGSCSGTGSGSRRPPPERTSTPTPRPRATRCQRHGARDGGRYGDAPRRGRASARPASGTRRRRAGPGLPQHRAQDRGPASSAATATTPASCRHLHEDAGDPVGRLGPAASGRYGVARRPRAGTPAGRRRVSQRRSDAARAATSPGGMSSPGRVPSGAQPSASETPPTSEASTGSPRARASVTTMP